MIIIKIKKH